MRTAERLNIINSDLFGIGDRLREIDSDYFVAYNGGLCRFEVHHRRQRGDTLALAVPYPALDARTVALAKKTRRENIDKLIKEMDEANRKIEISADKKILDNAKGQLEDELGKVKNKK